jgi:cytidine deaminase, homotetrameric
VTVQLTDEKGLLPEGAGALIENAARAALEAEGISGAYACVTVVNGEEIRALNKSTRGVDAETDVLSFPQIRYPAQKTARDVPQMLKKAYDPDFGLAFLGDIVLNIARAEKQALELGHSAARETAYLTAHAMFHLLGYDHMTDEDKRLMRAMEKRAMKALGLFRNGDRLMTHEDYIRLAEQALDRSYSPYSHFRVGACLVSESGKCFQGANFENASFGATICAERCAVSCAVVQGERRFTKIYIACDSGYAWPCGICRQVLNEFKSGDMEIWVGSPVTEWKMLTLSQLLPEGFGPEDVSRAAEG